MQGSCLCSSIRFKVKAFIPHTTNCHCSMCRKFHGAAFATYAVTLLDNFKWLAGKHLVQTYKAKNGTTRSFCKVCGSSLLFQDKENSKTIDVALGAMDDISEPIPEAHIYTSNKALWFEINDELPMFKQGHDF